MADSTVVGFIMLQFDSDDDDGQPFLLWRLMIAADHQRKGYGRAAVLLGVEECRRRNATELFTSWVLGDGGPEDFYLGLGFQPTGEWDRSSQRRRPLVCAVPSQRAPRHGLPDIPTVPRLNCWTHGHAC